jgi:hypothetical protein
MTGNSDDFERHNDFNRRWPKDEFPGLHKPGSQAANRIAATLQTQLAKVVQGREPEPLDHGTEARIRVIIREEIGKLVKQLPAMVKEINRRSRRRRAS